jgi:FAD/FMN-containing dehydrogenase
MCPLRLRGEQTWPLYPMRPGQVYVNFGFWGTVALPPGASDGYYNRQIEDKVTELGGHKGLYSTSFYPAEEFWDRYNGTEYEELKGHYDPNNRLANLYDKCVRGL